MNKLPHCAKNLSQSCNLSVIRVSKHGLTLAVIFEVPVRLIYNSSSSTGNRFLNTVDMTYHTKYNNGTCIYTKHCIGNAYIQ